MRIGVLSFQGDVREHIQAVERAGGKAFPVKRAVEISKLDGLIIPGGESTTISKFIQEEGMAEPIRAQVAKGMPLYGTCAGLIILARRVLNNTVFSLNILDVEVKRNAYGRQKDSFEEEIQVEGFETLYRGVFIRAPWITRVGPQVKVLARYQGKPVLVLEKKVLASTFHPELTSDDRIHRLFLGLVEGSKKG